MRKLGLIGGMSWLSTRTYYEHINRAVQRRLGPQASAHLFIESLDFRALSDLQTDEDWERAAAIVADSARKLELSGADKILITANVMHRMFDEIAEAVDIPILHIADCTAHRMEADKIGKALILGMRSAMTEGYLRDRLEQRGIECIIPRFEEIEEIHRHIVEELKLGKATRQAERLLKTVITVAEQNEAQAVVLACTELEMVVDVDANVVPIYDTARLHCEVAAEWVCADELS